MNVSQGDTAILAHPLCPENQDKTCTVVAATTAPEGKPAGNWWLCMRPAKMVSAAVNECALVTLFITEDWRLQRIAGPSIQLLGEDGLDFTDVFRNLTK